MSTLTLHDRWQTWYVPCCCGQKIKVLSYIPSPIFWMPQYGNLTIKHSKLLVPLHGDVESLDTRIQNKSWCLNPQSNTRKPWRVLGTSNYSFPKLSYFWNSLAKKRPYLQRMCVKCSVVIFLNQWHIWKEVIFWRWSLTFVSWYLSQTLKRTIFPTPNQAQLWHPSIYSHRPNKEPHHELLGAALEFAMVCMYSPESHLLKAWLSQSVTSLGNGGTFKI